MKALTLTQPWASLIALGEKRIETRSWAINEPQRIAIHAAKGLADPVRNEDGLRQIVASEPFAKVLWAHGIVVAEQLPRAVVVAEVDVIACVRMEELDDQLERPELAHFKEGEYERDFGDYSAGRWAWLLDNLVSHDPPVAARGGRKLWEWER